MLKAIMSLLGLGPTVVLEPQVAVEASVDASFSTENELIKYASSGKPVSKRILAELFGFEIPRSQSSKARVAGELRNLGFRAVSTNNPARVLIVSAR